MLNLPNIGDEVLDPNEKFNNLDGTTKYDQLLCDGSAVAQEAHPLLWGLLPAGVPTMNKDSSQALTWGTPQSICCNVDGGVVFVVDDAGILYKSTDYGKAFSETGETYYGQSFTESVACDSTGSIVYAAPYDGANYVVHKSTDGGVTSTKLTSLPTLSIRSLCCSLDGGIIYVGDTDTNNLYKSDNGGNTFTVVGSVSTISSANSLTCSADGEIVYSSNSTNSARQKSVDGGVTFNSITTENVKDYGLACSGDGNTLIAVQAGSVLYSQDGAASAFTYLAVMEPTRPNRCCIASDGSSGYVVVISGTDNDMGFVSFGKTTPDMTSPDPACPYRIVADLTQEA